MEAVETRAIGTKTKESDQTREREQSSKRQQHNSRELSRHIKSNVTRCQLGSSGIIEGSLGH